MQNDPSITILLHQWKDGDGAALDTLVPLVYSELRRLAASSLHREHGARTLDPTALVNEAYLRLVGGKNPDFNDRAHFLGVAARLMREILVDRARARRTEKRSGGARVPLENDMVFTGEHAAAVVELDDALELLAMQDPEKARILEVRFFGGLTAEESAAALGIPLNRINRQMRLAQAWLRAELAAD